MNRSTSAAPTIIDHVRHDATIVEVDPRFLRLSTAAIAFLVFHDARSLERFGAFPAHIVNPGDTETCGMMCAAFDDEINGPVVDAVCVVMSRAECFTDLSDLA